MASSLSSSLLFFYVAVFIILVISQSLQVDGVEISSHHVISVDSLLPSEVCSPFKEFNASSLKVVHRHGPCSPIKHKHKPAHEQILNQDQVRVDWLHRKATAASSLNSSPKPLAASKIPANIGRSFGTANYIVTVGFGTPKLEQSVVFDTGSDITWIQCKPCAGQCYQQQEQLFDPSQSSTYVNISCSSQECSALGSGACSGPTCVYQVQYGDNSYTIGFYVQDTLTLTPSDVIPSFRFGCGQQNNGLFGRTAGLLGLGRQQVSLVSQTSQKFGGVFSYCLPATSSSTGYLAFSGSSASSGVQFTPMLSSASMPTFYFLQLTGISVGGRTLSIPTSIFTTAGTIIDSGTVITRLPPTAYSALRSAFRQGMSKYPTAPALSILDTCYDLSKYGTVTVPKVALLFKGASASLDVLGTLYVGSTTQVCLAFAPNGDDTDLSILGNVQQRKFNVVYDVSKKLIGFGPGGC